MHDEAILWLCAPQLVPFFLYIRPVPSSRKALRLTAWSLQQCCRASCSHAMNNCVPRGMNLDLCLQVTLVHGNALGTAAPNQSKINLLHTQSRKLDVTVVVVMLHQI